VKETGSHLRCSGPQRWIRIPRACRTTYRRGQARDVGVAAQPAFRQIVQTLRQQRGVSGGNPPSKIEGTAQLTLDLAYSPSAR